jgi:hypothetical protein
VHVGDIAAVDIRDLGVLAKLVANLSQNPLLVRGGVDV